MKRMTRSTWIFVTAVAYFTGITAIGSTQGGVSAKRPFAAGRFAIILDGVNFGYVKGVDGGEIYSEVIQEKTGTGAVTKKHIGTPKYGDILLEVGPGHDPRLYEWITASWAQTIMRKNGAISTQSYDGREISRQEFFQALISETVIPTCDASSKEPAYMILRLTPEYTRAAKASGGAASLTVTPLAPRNPTGRPLGGGVTRPLGGGAATGGPASPQAAKLWIGSAFQLKIDGLDTTRVSKIESFSVKAPNIVDAVGVMRDYQKEPGKLEFPNLVIFLPEERAQTWIDWFDDFVIKGNCGDDKERTGTLDILAPNLQQILFTIKFTGLGICKLSRLNADSRSEQARNIRIELYCEKMEFKASK